MTTTNKFKETDIGEIPVEWEVKTIDDICEVKGGKRLPKGKGFSHEITPYPYIRVTDFGFDSIDLNNLEYLTSEVRNEIKRYTISTEDLYISIAGTIGKVGIIPEEIDGANLTENAAKLMIKSEHELDKEFLKFQMMSPRMQSEIQLRTTKTSQPKLALGRIKQLNVLIPSNTEQKAIAQKLTAIRNAIEQTQAVIEATEELKKSMMKHLFTYGPVPADQTDQVKLKETEIGLVPEGWRIAKLGKFVDVKGGYAFKSKYYSEDGIRVLRISNVSFGFADWEDVQYLPNDFLEKHSDYELKTGDLVMAMTRPVVSGGIKVAKLKERDVPSLLNQRVCKFEPSNEINTDYLFQIIFNKSFIEAISLGAIGSHQPNISATQIKNIKIPIPDIDLQKKIAKQLNKIDEKLSAERDRKSTLESLFNSTLESLMSAKIRVN